MRLKGLLISSLRSWPAHCSCLKGVGFRGLPLGIPSGPFPYVGLRVGSVLQDTTL